MAYFKTINDKEYYSKAFSAANRKTIEKNLYWLIPVAIASVIILAVGIRYLLRALKKSKNPTLQGVLYGGHVILHPFDGFWDIRHEKKGSFLSATIILIAAYLVDVLFIRFQPYVFQTLNLEETNVFVKGLSDIILPVLCGLFQTGVSPPFLTEGHCFGYLYRHMLQLVPDSCFHANHSSSQSGIRFGRHADIQRIDCSGLCMGWLYDIQQRPDNSSVQLLKNCGNGHIDADRYSNHYVYFCSA